jgi:hypothetical protein
MAVSERALNEYLNLSQVFRFPAGPNPQRIHLRGELPQPLTVQFHFLTSFFLYA